MNSGLSECFFNKDVSAFTQYSAYIKYVYVYKKAFHFQILWTQNYIPRFRGSATAKFKTELTNSDNDTSPHHLN